MIERVTEFRLKPEFGRGTGGLVDDQVRVENISLDEGVPAILREDERGVRIGIDLSQGVEAATRALSALLTERFASNDWKRGRTVFFAVEAAPPR